MMKPTEISIQDYTYHLPEEKIALHPLAQRDSSKLLIYESGKIQTDIFANITTHLPTGSLLVFNNTKVINARLTFLKTTGARVEIFCLEPYETVSEYQTVMSKTGSVKWKCFVGGAAKWKSELLEKKIVADNQTVVLRADKIKQEGETYIIQFSWEPQQYSFAAILQAAGNVPLPPYIKRATDEEDTARYQTIFAETEGSVAAPTAGLHFTDKIFEGFEKKSIDTAFVTLHVGAGTFKPVKAATMQDHQMHAEYIDVNAGTIKKLLDNNGIIAVGTTSLRTIESLYWLGVKTFLDPEIIMPDIKQWDVYNERLKNANISKHDALKALLRWMDKNNIHSLFTKTQLLIVPGYTFKMAKVMITNFHQPQSTLLLLVAAAVGDDWKKIYNYALENDFRFLSYGDANLMYIRS